MVTTISGQIPAEFGGAGKLGHVAASTGDHVAPGETVIVGGQLWRNLTSETVQVPAPGTRAAMEADPFFRRVDDGQILLTKTDTNTTWMWYKRSAPRLSMPRQYTLGGVTGAVITLSTPDAAQIMTSIETGRAYIEIHNISKTPAESCWLKAYVDASNLEVLDASTIAAWSTGDVLQLGNPDLTIPMVAVDISQVLQHHFGAPFQQKGLVLAGTIGADDSSFATGRVEARFSGSGAVGTVSNLSTNATALGGGHTVATPVKSPISDSNLLYFAEQDQSGQPTITVAAFKIVGAIV